jgi:riboflavin synthase
MFTGLIAELGTVADVRQDEDGATLRIDSRLVGELREGDSVAVNGVCLTAIEIDRDGFQAQAMHETLERSSLAGLRPGTRVNLELALRAQDRLGGHIVQGHVDGTGTVRTARPDGFSTVLEIDVDARLARYLVEKGSVAIDGVSLTVSALREDGFAVSLIPETLERTNLGAVGAGERVNIEVDILAKHVERLLRSPYGGATDSSEENGEHA